MNDEKEISLILSAVKFAAHKHRNQRRKGGQGSPYINHPIDVAETLWRLGGVRDTTVITAAILHDTVEDTLTTPEEVERIFGQNIRSLVEEVSDDKRLEKAERKRLQVKHAPHLSNGAKQIKLADKIFNVSEVAFSPPEWSQERRLKYLAWAEDVVEGLRGCNLQLDHSFDIALRVARRTISGATETK